MHRVDGRRRDMDQTNPAQVEGAPVDEAFRGSRRYHRIGQIVPSSNTTMETEIPAMLRAREGIAPERFTFHFAIMSMGHGYHRESERRLRGVAARNGRDVPVVTSAGALVDGLRVLGARRVSIVTPYMKPLTELVKSYIEAEDIEVLDTISLEISNNIQVGSRDPLALVDISKDLKVQGAEAVVISACVQMPSLEAIPAVEERLGLPVVSAAACTTYHMLKQLGLEASVPNAGALLSGHY